MWSTVLETLDQTHGRLAAGGARPAHYVATPPADAEAKAARVASPYD